MATRKTAEALRQRRGIALSGEVIEEDESTLSIAVGDSIYAVPVDSILGRYDDEGGTRLQVASDAQLVQSVAIAASQLRRGTGQFDFGSFDPIGGQTECSECSDCTECSECSDCTECSECVGTHIKYGHDLGGNPRSFRAPMVTRRLGR